MEYGLNADASSNGEPAPASAGTKRGYEQREDDLDVLTSTGKRHKYCAAVASDSTAAPGTEKKTKKRGYERCEDEFDVLIEKRYKGNYWAEPEHAALVRGWGSKLAREDALSNDHDRFMKEMKAMRARRRLQDPSSSHLEP